jgi:ribosomal protein S12 methylthiotransferase accessory factor
MTPPLDFLQTLRLESGIARTVTLSRPDNDRNPLWVLAVDIGQSDLAGRKQTGDDFSLSLVGAADIRRSGVYARAAGEAVERWALKPHHSIPPTNAVVETPGGANWRIANSRQPRPTYAGLLRSADGMTTTVRVPAEAVDYPAGTATDDTVDPSPSGTSAGAGIEDATERACKEALERDAAMRGWLSGRPLSPIDVDAVALIEPDFVRLGDVCTRLSLRWAVAALPTLGSTVRTMMAMIVDPRHAVACAGLGLERSEATSATRALQEAIQVRTVLAAEDAIARTPAPHIVTNDVERARFWASSAGVEAGTNWISGLTLPSSEPRIDASAPAWSTLLGEHIIIDLTARLPDVVRRMGWAVVKVLPVTAQPLRMSEAPSWNIVSDLAVRQHVPHPFV